MRARFVVLACLTILLGAAGRADAAPPGPGPIALLATIQIPGNPLKAFDISWVDPSSHRYFLADRSNAGVDLVDTQALRFVARVGGFVGDDKRGYDYGGPNGVLAIAEKHQLWAGDGKSRVQVIDLAANPPRVVKVIDTHGVNRADELAYDPADKLVMVANNADDPAFVTFISTEDYRILGKLEFPGTRYGVEQSVWDPTSGHFYLSVPVTHLHLAIPPIKAVEGEIAEIDPKAMKVTRSIKIIGCAGSGLALGLNGNLLQGCFRSSVTMIVNTRTAAITTIDQVGGSDEVWFNQGDNRYYLGAGMNHDAPVLGVIDARTNRWIQNVRTAPSAHSVAADSTTNRIFVPLTPNNLDFDNDAAKGLKCSAGCIGVYGAK